MITINGMEFHEKPASCYSCPFYQSDSSRLAPSANGFCRMFEENHKSYINPPKRCQKLFNKAFRYPDGTKLVIVANTGEEETA